MLLAAEIIVQRPRDGSFDMTDDIARRALDPRPQVAQLSVVEADVIEAVEHDAIGRGSVVLADTGSFGHVMHRSIPNRRYRRPPLPLASAARDGA